MKSKYIDISNIFKGKKPSYLEKHPANKDNKIHISDIDKTDVVGYSLLHHAVKNGDEEFVKLLLENGAFVNSVSTGQDKKKPLAFVANKIKEYQNQEEAIKYQNIQSILIDYGANPSLIKKLQHKEEKAKQRKQEFLEEIKDQLKTTEEIIRDKKKALNEQAVKECAEENKELEKVYLDFYKFLQGKFSNTILGIKSAASGFLKQEDATSTTIISTASEKILSVIPIIGKVLGTGVSVGYKYFANQKQLENFKHQANHLINNKYADEVGEDFCARIISFYKEDIINFDADVGHKTEPESTALRDVQLKLTSLLSGIAKKELLKKYQKEGEKIFWSHWEQIADKAIINFLDFLKNNEVDYKMELGVKSAESFLPNYPKGIMHLDAKLDKFSIDIAKKLGAVAQLAYESKKKIEAMSKDWGFEECYVRQSELFKSLVMCNEEKIIIGFRGTYHNNNWLNNFHALQTTITIKKQNVTVHTGFHEALMTHWDKGDSNEKPLKEIIKKYLNDYPEAKIYITGHSLGGAMASIAYCKLLELGIEIEKPIEINRVSLYTYGQPLWMTANSEAIVKELFKGNYYRIANYQDLVPTVPTESLGYKHLGELYYLHKDGKIIDQKTFDQIKLQKDEEGYDQITNNLVAKGLYYEQHFMSNYNKQLNNCKDIVISKETFVSQPINVNKASIAAQISDHLSKEALAKLKSLLINAKLEDHKQQDMVIKLMEDRIETTEISEPLQKSKSTKSTVKKKATNIWEAAEYGDLEKFQSFLDKGADINKVDWNGKTFLHYAALRGNEKLAEILLEKKPDLIDTVDKYGNTVLHLAAKEGHERLAEILLNKKPDLIDMVTKNGYTALHYASDGGYEKLAAMLLNKKPDLIDMVTKYDVTVLYAAAVGGHEKVVQMLLKAGASCTLDLLNLLNSKAQRKEGVAECYYLYGLRKSKEGEGLEVTKAYTKALELNPYKYDLTSSFVSSKLNKDFVQQLTMQTNSKFLYQLAVSYLLQNEYEKGLNIFNSTEVDARVKPAFSLGAALALVKLGKCTEAEQLLIDYKSTVGTLNTDYLYITAELMTGLKQYKEAFTCYSKLTNYGYHMEAIAGIGNLYFKTNQLGQAKECYQKILVGENIDFNLVERTKQQITFIETAEFINKQIAIEQTVQNLTVEFDKSLTETIVFDLVYAKKWLQHNLPESLISNYQEILNEIDYGYKLLNSEGILPKTFGFISGFLPKEKQLVSLARADKELRAEHDYFKIINNIYKQLKSLKEVISRDKTLKDDIKEEALDKINRIQDYYKYYIEQIIIKYGAEYRQTMQNDSEYVVKLSDIAEAKKPLLLDEKTKVQFEDGKHGFLESSLSQKLTTDKPQLGNKFGKHPVVEVNSVHYKYSPYAPGIEFAVNSLHNLILDGITPPSKLLKIYTASGQEKAIYLASKTIDGKNLQEILFLPTEYMQKLDMENYSGTIIACLLTSPGDAKPDNFMVTFGINKDRGKEFFKIVGIDNDISFCKGKLGVNKIAGKQKIYSDILNVLYFFPQMDELVSSKLKGYLTSSNIMGERIISSWLKALYMQNERYKILTGNGFTKEDLDEMKLPIKFKAGTVVEVYRKLDGIINLLKANEYITHNALFKKFYPGVSYFYEKIRQQSQGEFEAIKQLYIAAAESEELARQLVSREVQERDTAWNKISTSRMMNQETFKQVYDHTIEKEAEDFIAAIDFGKFGREDYAVFRMLQDNLNFVQELRLYNITEEQLNALLFTASDDQIVSKFNHLRSIKLSKSNVSNENLQKIIKYYTDQRMKITTSLNDDEVKSDISQVQLEHISKIINHNIDINHQDKDGNTALHTAVINGDIQSVKSLLDCGIDETIRNKQGKKAIDLAEEQEERIEIYQLIAEHEPQIFWSALGAAKGKIAAQLAKTMSIEKLTMPIKSDIVRSNCEPLEVALLNNGLADTALQLIKRLDINKSYGRDKDSSLHLLARNYNDTHVDIMEAMISKFPDLIIKRNNLGQTAADIAQDTKKYNFLILLMNKNCILSKFTNDNEEIVYKAAKYGIKVDKDDLKNGYNHNKCDKHKNNLLKFAVKNKDYELYEKIKAASQYKLENLYDNEGNHKLACNDQVNELIKIFREYGFTVSEKEAITGGINLNQTNGQGNSVLYELLKTICITNEDIIKQEEKVEALINAGINVNVTNRADKWTPMHLVASSQQEKYYVEKLMSKGGKLLEDVYNRTPIEIAKRCGYTDIENSLISIINENNAHSIEQPHHLPPHECEAGLLGVS